MQLLHNMENKTILLVNDKYRKMENFYFYDKMPYLSVFFYILRRIRMEENFFILYTIEVKGRERRNMEEKHTCVLNHDEYELLNFYRKLYDHALKAGNGRNGLGSVFHWAEIAGVKTDRKSVV